MIPLLFVDDVVLVLMGEIGDDDDDVGEDENVVRGDGDEIARLSVAVLLLLLPLLLVVSLAPGLTTPRRFSLAQVAQDEKYAVARLDAADMVAWALERSGVRESKKSTRLQLVYHFAHARCMMYDLMMMKHTLWCGSLRRRRRNRRRGSRCRSSCRSGRCHSLLVPFPLRFTHGFNICPEVVERRGDLLLTCCQMLSQHLFAAVEAFI